MIERRFTRLPGLVVAAVLAASVSGCDTLAGMNPFGEKEVKLQGERRPVPPVAPQPEDTVPQPLSALPAAGTTATV